MKPSRTEFIFERNFDNGKTMQVENLRFGYVHCDDFLGTSCRGIG